MGLFRKATPIFNNGDVVRGITHHTLYGVQEMEVVIGRDIDAETAHTYYDSRDKCLYFFTIHRSGEEELHIINPKIAKKMISDFQRQEQQVEKAADDMIKKMLGPK